MDLEYDQKFEEMKQYIPFLESMIKRLETTNNGVNNPRKAQLDKIRSLRDLLLDKKKRMKMENLLKCEQVLVNLYAKVEQRDSMADIKEDCSEQNQKQKSDLNIIRNKLKSVVSKLQEEVPETLPEIARATNTEVVCTPGSKEPALFQRRPNKISPNHPSHSSRNDDNTSIGKRRYTRVLMSPEHKKKEWSANSDTSTEKPLFSRRSPIRSPRRYSPSYKKERKKSSRQRSKSSQHSKDLNITLKVPEESLGSLNTKDILSRIINCSDNDVDIDTLRGLRSQILGELKQTGSKDDITDLILKSYKKKDTLSTKKDEVEEGELSDSESEAIENIYGSLVVVDEDNTNTNKVSSDKKHPRKIQICLVINSDKEKDNKNNAQKLSTTLDVSDFEAYEEKKTQSTLEKEEDEIVKEITRKEINEKEMVKPEAQIETKCINKELEEELKSPQENPTKTENNQSSNEKVQMVSQMSRASTDTFKPEFYKPFIEEKATSENTPENQNSCKSSNTDINCKKDEITSKCTETVKNFKSLDTSANIHIEKVSEIDILQALKKEILGETPTVSMSETITPPLHQPKITKVASALEIAPKKRISIEKYKLKSVPCVKQPLFNSTNENSLSKDDNSKKQSLKLTEKECERFNFPVDVSPVDSSDDEDKLSSKEFRHANSVRKSSDDKNNATLDFEFLGNSVPKSPDHEDFADTGIKPPVIIPSDPVKYVVASTKVDVDMRTVIPLLSPDGSGKSTSSPSITSEKEIEATWTAKSNEKIRKPISDPRVKTELNQPMANDSPRPRVSYPNITPNTSPSIASNIPALMSLNASYTTPNLSTNIVSSITSVITPILNSNIPLLMNPNMTPSMLPNMNPGLAPSVIPNMNPSMTPSRMVPSMNPMMTPILTPNARSYEMTPRSNLDNDDYSNQKHVYAPIFPTFESHDFSEKDTLKWEDRNSRSTSVQRDIDYHINRTDRYKGDKRLDSPQTQMECPSTPNAPFGRMECPQTPIPSFGRETSMTSVHSSGRSDCPMTPSHSFGRLDCPMTPSHSFGRSDCPMTPSHSFGRSDPNMTPTNVFGRGDYHHNTSSFSYKYTKSHDPRLNRSSDYDKYQGRCEERNRSHFEDDRSMTENTYKYRRSQVKSYGQVSRNSRDRMSSHRESSVGRSLPRDYDAGDSYGKDYYSSDSRYRREKYKYMDDVNKRREYSAGSIERMNTSEDTVSMRERGRMYTRKDSIEKPISVQSHTGRSFNIDTSFNRTFQETKLPSLNTSFDDRRRRASSVGRSLRDSPRKDLKRSSTNNCKFELNLTDHKTMQFRRACSVGRDLKEYNADKNFNDIKEDLRSYKFNNYDFKLRDQGHNSKKQSGYTNEKVVSNEPHSIQDAPVAYQTSSMSTEHQINRDPRKTIRNSNQYINKSHDNVKYSPRNNFRDPRMRRDIDVRTPKKYNDRNSSSSRYKNYGIVYSNDNIAKGMVLASAGGVKNFKIPKIKRPAEEKEVKYQTKPSESDTKKEVPSKNSNKEDNVNIEQGKKGESKQTKPVISSIEKRRNLQNENENVATLVNEPKPIEDSTKMADKTKSQENTDSANFTSANGGRRITRSANKVGPPSKLISKTSPVRKLRRIKRLIYDSDSDSQEADGYVKNNNEECKTIQTIEDKEEHKNDFAIENEENIEKSFNMQQQPGNTKHMESENCVYENDINIKTTNDKNALAIKEKPALPQKELCEEQNNSLDISFGVDDELFPDNIASESVLDNINALIADLDHDIEAPKINDFNDKFINNIVGSISPNDSVPFDGSKTDFSADVMLDDRTEFVVQETAIRTSFQVPLRGDNRDKIEVTHLKNNPKHVNDLIQSNDMLDIQNESKVMKDNAIESATLTTSNADKTVFQENSTESTYEVQKVMKNLDTDAVVSTTANDEKTDENSVSQTSSVNITISDKGLEETESFPDSTNDLTSELNNDITSTHNSNDMSSKEQSSTNSTCSENIPRIDSIGKLLSILEDKKKIKELLTMLGKDSGENEKIKKKLEKLSEIVSDDEEILGEGEKDTSEQEKQTLKLNNEKDTVFAVDKLIPLDDNNESVIDTENIEEPDMEKSIVARTMQCYDGPLCKKDSVNNDINKMDDDQCNNIKEQEIVDIDLARNNSLSCMKLDNETSIETISKDVNETGDDNKRVNEKEAAKNVKDVDVNTNEEIIEEALKTNEKEFQNAILVPMLTKSGKKITKKSKITKRGRSKLAKKLSLNKEKRVTRSEAECSQPQNPSVPKKPSRELLKLQEDIRDMFIREDILNATGIRMCRLAKLVNDKNIKGDTQTTEADNAEPIVVLENISSKMSSDESLSLLEKKNKKRGPKSKANAFNQESESKGKLKYKPGPKSKTKTQEHDPYFFENDSIEESNNTVNSRDQNTDSDSDSVSTKSFGSSDVPAELKKKTKRKRRSWQLGVIKKKGIKNKTAVKLTESSIPTVDEIGSHERKDKILHGIPDLNCFTDKSYCFHRNVKSYLCRLCGYKGNDIVPHYKKHHPHSEIPLSRLNPVTAKAAIEQCENFNLQAIIKIQTMKYVCRFCFQEFHKPTTALETFFWHVVSVHTGEYKQICSECINVTRCPLHLDIPPPPKNLKGQLIGYICGRCNFTQVSLENLKTHVIIRHDDEQTEVYPINLGEISRKALQTLIKKASVSSFEVPRMLRSARSLHSHQSVTEPSDDCSDNTDITERIAGLEKAPDELIQEIDTSASPTIAAGNKIQSKLIFESDDFSDTSSYSKNDEIIQASVKLERDEDTQDSLPNPIDDTVQQSLEPESESEQPRVDNDESAKNQAESRPSSDVLDYPHFKVKLSETGTKEYVCCINGIDNHYKTTLLISFKKHVQLKHPENWDGYCFICKVIVTGQGKHTFKDCLQHFFDKHMDNFPVLDETVEPTVNDVSQPATSTPIKDMPIPKSYINVRPLSELISSEQLKTQEENPLIPKIKSVMSLGAPTDPSNSEPQNEKELCNYEEAQAEIMKMKHRVVLEAMLSHEKLIQVFKCSGRFCSYTTNNAEEALLHASTHQKIGGVNSLKCVYCDFDSSGNAIDLVMHIFKNYSHCSYACSKCFYRAAGGQLVYAHVKRVHTESETDEVPILRSATLEKDTMTENFLCREGAVLYYICNNRNPDGPGVCQFKSYVMTKFRDHLLTKHGNDAEYSCNMCNFTASCIKMLLLHLKSHEMKIYQCSRCLCGADTEAKMIEHASEKHPFRQPKAYVRVITLKGGSSDPRVLPLAILSNKSVKPIVVTSSPDKESPVKQAERSIDLEKLIGQTNLIIESMSTITNEVDIEPEDVIVNEREIQVQSEQASCSTPQPEPGRTSPAILTLLQDPQTTANKHSADVKSETLETTNPETDKEIPDLPPIDPLPATSDTDVVCLDSDEDNSCQNFIDISNDNTTAESNITKNQQDETNIKIPRSRLYLCSKCTTLSKSEGMFKRHIISCFSNPNEQVKCAYCSHVAAANTIVIHYNNDHLENCTPFICTLCKGKFVSLVFARKHLKHLHKVTSITVTTDTSTKGMMRHLVYPDMKERQAPKRKFSGENKITEPAHKLKKYGPQDIDKLPINPILDNLVYCSLCEFNTKVRLNMVRHLQMHAEQQPVSQTAPVNPVPHLESNEKHFDRMVNLASSSIINSNKSTKDGSAPEALLIYPKYVSDRVRYTCGAKDCSYISVKESMLRIHWETLHAGTDDFHCVHCPPRQLDKNKPMTVARILAHLKMHDSKLYACSLCRYYHHTRKAIEKHLKEVHSRETGKLTIIREDGAALPPPTPAPTQSSTAPTMDLKPWQCGLCQYKSMLCPEVIEHCGKFHQSKMQFKCTYCGFRTSNIENISKHQLKQHPGKKEEVFYFYYREGSIPDEADGTSRWQKQSQKNGPEIKIETGIPPPDLEPTLPKPASPNPPNPVNLDIVKKEVVETDAHVHHKEDIEELCTEFGQFCEPNGLSYKCSLCKAVIEDTKEAMQSHLYEELQYRKWGCGVCSYKAFHKPGLQQHVQTEHGHSREAREPVELEIDPKIETWVANLLDHQTAIIERNKENLAKQKAEILRANPGGGAKVAEKPAEPPKGCEAPSVTMAGLEKLFGPFGVPTNMNYTCPKCNISARTESVMQEHLENELNKIRWFCNNCNETFQTYHEAQFHCRSVHPGMSSRPMEATRNIALRAAWVAAALRVQKLSMNYKPVSETHVDMPAQLSDNSPENSLLVVRYEEKVPTPEEQMLRNRKTMDDDKVNADEPEKKKNQDIYLCSYCPASYKYENFFQCHVLKHYGLKPYTCPYCPHNDTKKAMEVHITSEHPNRSVAYLTTPVPKNALVHDCMTYSQQPASKPIVVEIESKIICLGCEESMTKAQSQSHLHDNVRPQFAMKGNTVYRCSICLTLHKTSADFNLHHKQFHGNEKKNTFFYKLDDDNRSLYCAMCKQYFSTITQYRTHHQTSHRWRVVEVESSQVIEKDDELEAGGKRKAEDDTILPVAKRVAKKSTTKLPLVMAVARKSTTKLPFDARCDDEEYSYYGTRPSMDNLENVTTLMPFCNTFVPFTLKKLNEIIKIYPVVVVKDINDKQ